MRKYNRLDANYASLRIFDTANDTDSATWDNNANYFIDDVLIIKRALNVTETRIIAKTVIKSIIIPKINTKARCWIPGFQVGNLPSDIAPDLGDVPNATVRPFPLTSEWASVGFRYHDFFDEQLVKLCGTHLTEVDLNYAAGKITWENDYYYKYAIADIQGYWVPRIRKNFMSLDAFRKFFTSQA